MMDRGGGRAATLELLITLIDNDLDVDRATDEWMARREHVVSGECIYGCRFCDIPEGAVTRVAPSGVGGTDD